MTSQTRSSAKIGFWCQLFEFFNFSNFSTSRIFQLFWMKYFFLERFFFFKIWKSQGSHFSKSFSSFRIKTWLCGSITHVKDYRSQIALASNARSARIVLKMTSCCDFRKSKIFRVFFSSKYLAPKQSPVQVLSWPNIAQLQFSNGN